MAGRVGSPKPRGLAQELVGELMGVFLVQGRLAIPLPKTAWISILISGIVFFSKRRQHRLETIGLDLKERRKQQPEATFGKAFSRKPHHVGLGQVDELSARIATEGHLHPSNFDQYFGVESRLLSSL